MADRSYAWIYKLLTTVLRIIRAYITEYIKEKRQRFNKTEGKFKDFFSRCIMDLQTPVTGPSIIDLYEKETSAFTIMKHTISEQIGIAKEFQNSIPKRKRSDFQKSWHSYCPLDDVFDERTRDFWLLDYMSNTKEQEIEIRKKLIKSIEDLLKFAN